MGLSEFALIERIRARAAGRDDVLLGIGDDAALLQPPAGQALAVSTDTLNLGVHFSADVVPADLGWKALAVNLSDLAAMAATPAWATLSLSLPTPDAAWLDGFLDGLLALATAQGVAVVGGDTTHGPLSISLTVIGFVPADQALRRDGAGVGDGVWISGTTGDAAAALALGDAAPAALRERLHRPTPRLALGRALRGIASACIDISDGLIADLGHLLVASGVGAELCIADLPISPALRALDDPRRLDWQLAGGDDYELCFSVPAAQEANLVARLDEFDVALARIGRIVAGSGCRVLDDEGRPLPLARAGYDHFERR